MSLSFSLLHSPPRLLSIASGRFLLSPATSRRPTPTLIPSLVLAHPTRLSFLLPTSQRLRAFRFPYPSPSSLFGTNSSSPVVSHNVLVSPLRPAVTGAKDPSSVLVVSSHGLCVCCFDLDRGRGGGSTSIRLERVFSTEFQTLFPDFETAHCHPSSISSSFRVNGSSRLVAISFSTSSSILLLSLSPTLDSLISTTHITAPIPSVSVSISSLSFINLSLSSPSASASASTVLTDHLVLSSSESSTLWVGDVRSERSSGVDQEQRWEWSVTGYAELVGGRVVGKVMSRGDVSRSGGFGCVVVGSDGIELVVSRGMLQEHIEVEGSKELVRLLCWKVEGGEADCFLWIILSSRTLTVVLDRFGSDLRILESQSFRNFQDLAFIDLLSSHQSSSRLVLFSSSGTLCCFVDIRFDNDSVRLSVTEADSSPEAAAMMDGGSGLGLVDFNRMYSVDSSYETYLAIGRNGVTKLEFGILPQFVPIEDRMNSLFFDPDSETTVSALTTHPIASQAVFLVSFSSSSSNRSSHIIRSRQTLRSFPFSSDALLGRFQGRVQRGFVLFTTSESGETHLRVVDGSASWNVVESRLVTPASSAVVLEGSCLCCSYSSAVTQFMACVVLSPLLEEGGSGRRGRKRRRRGRILCFVGSDYELTASSRVVGSLEIQQEVFAGICGFFVDSTPLVVVGTRSNLFGYAPTNQGRLSIEVSHDVGSDLLGVWAMGSKQNRVLVAASNGCFSFFVVCSSDQRISFMPLSTVSCFESIDRPICLSLGLDSLCFVFSSTDSIVESILIASETSVDHVILPSDCRSSPLTPISYSTDSIILYSRADSSSPRLMSFPSFSLSPEEQQLTEAPTSRVALHLSSIPHLGSPSLLSQSVFGDTLLCSVDSAVFEMHLSPHEIGRMLVYSFASRPEETVVSCDYLSFDLVLLCTTVGEFATVLYLVKRGSDGMTWEFQDSLICEIGATLFSAILLSESHIVLELANSLHLFSVQVEVEDDEEVLSLVHHESSAFTPSSKDIIVDVLRLNPQSRLSVCSLLGQVVIVELQDLAFSVVGEINLAEAFSDDEIGVIGCSGFSPSDVMLYVGTTRSVLIGMEVGVSQLSLRHRGVLSVVPRGILAREGGRGVAIGAEGSVLEWTFSNGV